MRGGAGRLPTPDDVETRVFASEPLLVGLRPGHRLAAATAVDLRDLQGERLGHDGTVALPAWTASQRDALADACVSPPVVPLRPTDLNAAGWLEQADVDWVLLIGSLTSGHTATVVRPVTPAQDVPFVLQWVPSRVRSGPSRASWPRCSPDPCPRAGTPSRATRSTAAPGWPRRRVDRKKPPAGPRSPPVRTRDDGVPGAAASLQPNLEEQS